MVVGERDGVRGETRLREVGEWGEFAGVDERLLGDASVVADGGERGLGEGGEFHVNSSNKHGRDLVKACITAYSIVSFTE